MLQHKIDSVLGRALVEMMLELHSNSIIIIGVRSGLLTKVRSSAKFTPRSPLKRDKMGRYQKKGWR